MQQQTSNSSIQTFLSTKGELIDLIHRNIPEATLNPQTAEDTILFLIPFKSQTKFVNMFQDLNEYEFITINLEMNSLEDAFVNIGMDEEQFIEKNMENNIKTGLNVRQSHKIKEISERR